MKRSLVIVGYLRAVRVHRGIQQKEMAEKLKISQASYSRIENGKSVMNLDQLCSIMEILGVKFYDIYFTFMMNE